VRTRFSGLITAGNIASLNGRGTAEVKAIHTAIQLGWQFHQMHDRTFQEEFQSYT
jgi:hypothetical protein